MHCDLGDKKLLVTVLSHYDTGALTISYGFTFLHMPNCLMMDGILYDVKHISFTQMFFHQVTVWEKQRLGNVKVLSN